MEQKFILNWHAIVDEAKHRRKSIRLTQQRLSELSGVSTPTISRFESGDQNIQLSTMFKIIGVLGMMDRSEK